MKGCFSCGKNKSPPRRQNTLKSATNKALRILAQTTGVPPLRRAAIRRELARRNKENYGYELAKMFGVSPPPSNRPTLSNANALLRGVTDPKTVRTLRSMLHPAHAEQLRVSPNKPKNPVATMYRSRRKLPFINPLTPMFMTLNRRYENNEAAYPDPYSIADLTTYIDPSKFNFIYARTSLDAQNFWTQIGVDITARRKMSAKIMPNL